MTCRKLPGASSIRLFFVINWVTYFSIYLGRLNFSASMSDMVERGGFPKSELGVVAAAFYFSYGGGQLLSGILGDRLPARWLVFAGLLGTGAVNLAFPFFPDAAGMTLLWFLNGLAQSLIWSPMARLIADRTSGSQCVRMVLLLSTTGPAGMLCAYALSAAALRAGSWKGCFWAAAAVILPVAALWMLGIGRLERLAERRGEYEQDEAVSSPAQENGGGSFWKTAAASGLWTIAAAACLHGVLKDGLTTWVPTCLTEEFAIAPAFSVTLTTVLPVVNLAGVFLADRLNRRLCHETLSSMCFFIITLAAIAGMMLLGAASLPGSVLLFAAVTTSMTAVNTLLISLVPLYFRKSGAVSTVSGALGAATYLGTTLASGLFGSTAERMGWNGTRAVWCAVALLGVALCWAARKRWRAFTILCSSGSPTSSR